MKNFLFLMILGFISHSSLFSQNLELMKKDGSAIVNDTLLLSTSDDISDIIAYVYVKNNASKPLDVKTKAYVKNLVAGSGASYCWSTGCFDIGTTEPDLAKTINSADTAKEFHSDYSPNQSHGVSEIMYTFYNKNSVADSVSLTIIYEVISTGVDPLHVLNQSISSYPNPVKDILNFEYHLGLYKQGEIFIYDLLGQKVKQKSIINAENFSSIYVSDLKSGIYFWTITVEGIPVKSEKFIKY